MTEPTPPDKTPPDDEPTPEPAPGARPDEAGEPAPEASPDEVSSSPEAASEADTKASEPSAEVAGGAAPSLLPGKACCPEDGGSPFVPGGARDLARASEAAPAEAVIIHEAEPPEDLAQQSLSQALNVAFGILRVLMIALVVLFFAECLRTVEEGQIALKKRFGRFVRDDQGRVRVFRADSQFVFVWPFPIEQLHVLPLGSDVLEVEDTFWPVAKVGEQLLDETEMPVQSVIPPGRGGYNLTGDRNIVHTRWTVEYRISDPVRFVERVAGDTPDAQRAMARALLAATVHGVIMKTVAGAPVDQVLTGNLAARIQEDLRAELEGPDGLPRWGIEVTAVNNRRVRPPAITAPYFNRVTGALAEKKKLETEARAYAGRLTSQAESEARKVVLDAEVDRRRIVEQAKADAAVLNDLLTRFRDDEAGLRLYLSQRRQDALEGILEDANLYLLPEGHRGVIQLAPSAEEVKDDKSGEGGGR